MGRKFTGGYHKHPHSNVVLIIIIVLLSAILAALIWKENSDSAKKSKELQECLLQK